MKIGILYNSGKYVQAYRIQYMDERMRNKERWVNHGPQKIRNNKKVTTKERDVTIIF